MYMGKHTCLFPNSVLWEGRGAATASSNKYTSTWAWFPEVTFQHEEPKLLGEVSESSPGSQKISDEPGALTVTEREELRLKKKKDGAFQRDTGTNLKELEMAKDGTNFSWERERTELYLKELLKKFQLSY